MLAGVIRADSGMKPGRHPAKSRIQGNPRQRRHTGVQSKVCAICGLSTANLAMDRFKIGFVRDIMFFYYSHSNLSN